MVLCFTPAFAQDSARRGALNNNILIKDYSDISVFPQDATKYKRTVRLNTDGAKHSGTVLSGTKDAAWGVGFSNSGLGLEGLAGAPGAGGDGGGMAEPMDTPMAPPEAAPMAPPEGEMAHEHENPLGPHQMIDVYYARGNWGLHLGVGLGGATAEEGENKLEASAMDIAANFGMNMGANDLGIAIGLSGSEVVDQVKNSGLTAAVFFRGYKPQSEGVELGYFAWGAFASAATEPEGDADKTEMSGLTVQAGAGPVIEKGGSTVSIYGEVGFSQGSTKTGENEASGSAILVPGVNAGFETALNDWTHFRAGMGYQFMMTSGEMGESKMSGMTGDASWGVGLSAKWNSLVFDLDVEKSFLTRGPHMVSGAQGNLASNVSATYSF
jgi:hypothetical protein